MQSHAHNHQGKQFCWGNKRACRNGCTYGNLLAFVSWNILRQWLIFVSWQGQKDYQIQKVGNYWIKWLRVVVRLLFPPRPRFLPKKQSSQKEANSGISKADPEGGKAYDSRLEAKHGAEYQAMLERGEIRKLERQKVFTLHAGIKYIADFLITHLDGSLEAVDSKGMETAIFKLKKKLFFVDFPGVKLTIRKAAKAGKRTKAANKR